MKAVHCFILTVLTVLASSCVWNSTDNELAVCGEDRLLVIDTEKSTADSVHVVWSWKVSEATSQLPEEYQSHLRVLDECKMYEDNSKFLLTSSTGGALLLERETKKCLFYAKVPMAHSAELLPGNRVAIALSLHPKGNSLELYDVDRSEICLYRDSLYSGHGVVWMEKQSLLYALGYYELRAYSLKDWETSSPQLQLEKTWTLPHSNGHDLSRVSENELLVSGHDGVVWFNTETETFAPFEPLKDVENVKSVNYDKESGELFYTKAEISWWTHHIYGENPSKVFTIEDIDLYKVRR